MQIDIELKKTMHMLEKQKSISRQMEEDMKKPREGNTRLCKECIVLHREKEADDAQSTAGKHVKNFIERR